MEQTPFGRSEVYIDHERSEQIDIIYELTAKYSNQLADTEYRLAELGLYPNGERRLMRSWAGDSAWAQRHCKHYGMEMPKETK